MPTEARCKRLTLFLGECWHEVVQETPYEIDGADVVYVYTCSCGNDFNSETILKHIAVSNRTFTAEADMMDLYQRLWRVVGMQSWFRFYDEAMDIYHETHNPCECLTDTGDFTAWLFCLSGEGYEERCDMVGEFLEGEK